jgi:hypothetical protein
MIKAYRLIAYQKSYSKSTSEQKDNFSKLNHVNHLFKIQSIKFLIIFTKLKNEEDYEIDNPLDFDLSMEIISHQ